MALSDFTGPGYIDAWTRDLDTRWPERAVIADCVVRTLVEWRVKEWRGEWRGAEDRDGSNRKDRAGNRDRARIRLLELGVGAGGLAQAVLDALTVKPETGQPEAVEYTGIDIEPALVQHGKARLGSAGYRDARLVQANLKDGIWTRAIEPVDAVFTLQTIHDLGGIDALDNIYRQIHGILVSGGILVNADFVFPFEKDDPERPRRLPVETHQDLLSSLGFVDFRCEMQIGKMACMSAGRP